MLGFSASSIKLMVSRGISAASASTVLVAASVYKKQGNGVQQHVPSILYCLTLARQC